MGWVQLKRRVFRSWVGTIAVEPPKRVAERHGCSAAVIHQDSPHPAANRHYGSLRGNASLLQMLHRPRQAFEDHIQLRDPVDREANEVRVGEVAHGLQCCMAPVGSLPSFFGRLIQR